MTPLASKVFDVVEDLFKVVRNRRSAVVHMVAHVEACEPPLSASVKMAERSRDLFFEKLFQ